MNHRKTFCIFFCVAIAFVAVAIDTEKTLALSTNKEESQQKTNAASLLKPVQLYECRFTEDAIKIDGKLDDAWKKAVSIENFSMPWLGKKNRLPEKATRAKILWDREFLYVFADMDDADLFANITEHDGNTWENDVFELFLKPAVEKPAYYEFHVSAANTQFDVFLPQRGEVHKYKKIGEFDIESKVVLRGSLNKRTDSDTGWSVELRIPWSSLMRAGGRPEPNEQWRFALCRYDYNINRKKPELTTCAPLDSKSYPDFHTYEDFATIRFVGHQSQRTFGFTKLSPKTTSKVIGSPDPQLPYRPKKAYPQLKANYPVAARHIPGTDELLFLDETGPYSPTRLRRMKDRPEVTKIETLLESDGSVAYDICFHPNYRHNGYVYIGSNGAGSGGKKYSRVTRYHLDPKPPYLFAEKSAKVIIEWVSNGHNGAAIAFGPDGMLYVTSGDGTSDSDRNVAGQRLDLLLSKVLRIDIDQPTKGKMYSVPKDNPFVGQKNVRTETWAYGLRNPWRIAIDQQNGNVWVGNNGQDLYEQVYLVKRGANFGWSIYEGSHLFYPSRELGPTPVTMPIFEHHHTESRSLTGGVIYRGKKLPELNGAYIYGDHSTGKIWAALHDGKKVVWHKELADTPFNITGFALDRHGELLVLDHRGNGEGNFYHLEPTPKNASSENFPTKLSESGLFRSVRKHEVESSLIPYSVNSPHWADGASQFRYMALPDIDSVIGFRTPKSWTFPEKTVLVKSLSLEMTQGNPNSRRFIETQLLTKQQGEWIGYTYAWNDEGTDATLVDRDGMDRSFDIQTNKGTRKHIWHFASRSECMSCHSRAAEYVLGITTMQMNRKHQYKNYTDHQFQTFESLGLFRFDWKSEATRLIRKKFKAKGISDSEANKRLQAMITSSVKQVARKSPMFSQPPNKFPKLAAIDDSAPLDKRVRSYLNSNCAHCHVEAGGGNAQIKLNFATPRNGMKLIGVKPVHATFGLPGAKLVVPGDPYRSVLYYRLMTIGGGRMPRIGSHVVDKQAAVMIRKWIEQMSPTSGKISAEELQIRTVLRKEAIAITSLKNAKHENLVSEKIKKLLNTTSGALALLDACEEGKLPDELRKTIVTKGASHLRIQTRDLFERFLSPEKRTRRLGHKIDPKEILALEGNAERGRILFKNGIVANCKSCHRLGDGQTKPAPDLSEIGNKFKRHELLESILFPSKKIDDKYRTSLVVTNDGKTHAGLIVKQDAKHVVILGSDNKEKRFARGEIDEIVSSSVSIMPEGLCRDMTAQQLADLLALLEAAKKKSN